MQIRDIANEIAREINVRRAVFPRLIAQGKLSQGEAEERMDRLHACSTVLSIVMRLGVKCPEDVHQLRLGTTELNTIDTSTVPISHIKGAV